MKVVIDTNVLVSGFLSPYQAPGAIVRMISDLTLHLAYDARILTEYETVLTRPEFGFKPEKVEAFLEQIKARGQRVVGKPLPKPLPDETDQMFLEITLAAGAEYLVTGNLKHFPKALCQGVKVCSPADFLELYSKSR